MKKRDGNNKYNILVVIRWPIGGIRSFINYTYNNFPNTDRFHFRIICPNYGETKALLEDLKHLNVSYIPLGPNFSSVKLLKALVRTICSENIDLIHSHGLTAGIHTSAIARIFQIPHILTLHELLCNDQSGSTLKLGIKLKILSFLISMLDVIHLVSNDAKDNILECSPCLKNGRTKLAPILNGVDISRYVTARRRDLRAELNLSENTFLIGFLGRYMPVKGFRYLIDAFEYVLVKGNSLKKRPVLLTFGWQDGFIREDMKIVKQKGIDKSVISLPFVPDVADTLRGLDLVIMPSLSEACGVLAMEAMVSGVPIIGTNCIGLREVLHDTPNVMVPPGDSLALAKALLKEIEHPSRLSAELFREEAASRFNVRKQSLKLEELMLKLINS
jgi:glycosyltransferase involved in cell wall biosynthesis